MVGLIRLTGAKRLFIYLWSSALGRYKLWGNFTQSLLSSLLQLCQCHLVFPLALLSFCHFASHPFCLSSVAHFMTFLKSSRLSKSQTHPRLWILLTLTVDTLTTGVLSSKHTPKCLCSQLSNGLSVRLLIQTDAHRSVFDLAVEEELLLCSPWSHITKQPKPLSSACRSPPLDLTDYSSSFCKCPNQSNRLFWRFIWNERTAALGSKWHMMENDCSKQVGSYF